MRSAFSRHYFLTFSRIDPAHLQIPRKKTRHQICRARTTAKVSELLLLRNYTEDALVDKILKLISSAKELQEQVRSGDASATELFELGAVTLRRKFYPAAAKYLMQAIDKWDGDGRDLAQVYNALGVWDGKLEKGIAQFETAVKLQPGYVTAWNYLGDAYEKKKDLKSALKAFKEVLLFDPNNQVARPRRDALRDRVTMYKGVPVKSKEN